MLARACELHHGQRINAYMNSREAQSHVLYQKHIRKAREFLTSSGKPVKHADLINRLFTAFSWPSKIAVLKVEIHTTETSAEAHGNALADQSAKECSLIPGREVLMLAMPFGASLEEFKMLQSQPGLQELVRWMAAGASQGLDGIWGLDGR